NQPLDVAQAVTRDLAKGFAPGRTTAPTDVPLERWRFQESYPWYNDPPTLLKEYGGGPPRWNESWTGFLRDYQVFGYTPGTLLAASLIAGLLGAVGVRLRRTPRAPGLQAACLLPSTAAIALLTLSAAFEFSWRYQLPSLVLLPVAGAFGVTALIGTRKAPTPTPEQPEDSEPSDSRSGRGEPEAAHVAARHAVRS
ncbi:hypothetical protein ACFQ07_19415, partial [Actinomadura adrarensis]